MFESDNDDDYPVDAGGEDFEVMKESEQMPELIAPVAPVPVSTCPTQQICSIVSVATRDVSRTYLAGVNTSWATSILSTEISALGWNIRARTIRRTIYLVDRHIWPSLQTKPDGQRTILFWSSTACYSFSNHKTIGSWQTLWYVVIASTSRTSWSQNTP